MTILDGKDPVFYFSDMTADGRWMVASAPKGQIVVESSFIGTNAEAEAICEAFNKRAMAQYESDSRNQVSAVSIEPTNNGA